MTHHSMFLSTNLRKATVLNTVGFDVTCNAELTLRKQLCIIYYWFWCYMYVYIPVMLNLIFWLGSGLPPNSVTPLSFSTTCTLMVWFPRFFMFSTNTNSQAIKLINQKYYYFKQCGSHCFSCSQQMKTDRPPVNWKVYALRTSGPNFIELLNTQICLAWNFFRDKNRITNQISICCMLLVTGIQLLVAYPENHVKILLVILFLSKQKFHA